MRDSHKNEGNNWFENANKALIAEQMTLSLSDATTFSEKLDGEFKQSWESDQEDFRNSLQRTPLGLDNIPDNSKSWMNDMQELCLSFLQAIT
eukprot:gene279-11681_t